MAVEHRRPNASRRRGSNAALFGGFAVLALTIAAIGVGGVLAFSISERTREFGIRMALGADRLRILCGVLSEGLVLAGAGLVIGVTGALLLSRFLEGLLFEVTPLDTLTFAATGVSLALVALAAAWVPARRATQRRAERGVDGPPRRPTSRLTSNFELRTSNFGSSANSHDSFTTALRDLRRLVP